MKKLPILLVALLLSLTTLAQVGTISGPSTICPGSSATYSCTPSGGVWMSSNLAVAAIGSASGVATPISPGVTTLTYITGSGSTTYTITVNPNPAAISGPSALCNSMTATYTNATTGGTWTSSNPAIVVIVTGIGIASGTASGTATITYTISTGCYSTKNITVNPSVPAISGPSAFCEGTAATYTNATTGGTWTGSNPSIAAIGSASGLATGVTSGTTTITYTLATGCYSTKSITVHPFAPAISGPSSVCFCGGGSITTLGNSVAGGMFSSSNAAVATVNWATGAVCGIAVGGTAVITYTLPTGCFATHPVTVVAAPSALNGNNVVCVGGTTTLTNTISGGIWSSSNPAVASFGTAGVISGNSAGTSVITYSLSTTGCYATRIVTVVPGSPSVFSTTGGGSFCSGGSGIAVGLSGSQAGVFYQLYNGASAMGTSMVGTGGALSFGLMTSPGTYTIVANAGTSCATTMSGSAVVVVDPLPTNYTVTGGGYYSGTGSGIAIGLSGSQIGTNYQLMVGSTAVGSPLAGTGGALSFGLHTTPSVYTVVATNSVTTCTRIMSGYAIVTTVSSPAVFTVTGGGSYCAGGVGVTVGLSGSQAGVFYQLYNGSTSIGTPVAGTGSSISFGLQVNPGTYSVTASPGTSASTAMSGSAIVGVNAAPISMFVNGGGFYSGTGGGLTIGLNSSELGATYRLYLGTALVGVASGTGGIVIFGGFTVAGTYTATGTYIATGCVNNMGGSATITTSALPTAFTVTGGGTFCLGGVGLVVGLSGSQTGVSYQLYRGSTAVGSPVSGTGSAISFGLQTVAGTYTVTANPGTSSSTAMSGSAVVVVNPAPPVYSITPTGTYCSGSPITIGLSGSQTGSSYQLFNGATPVGSAVSGTGSAITFGAFTASGTYTVIVNPGTPCAAVMSGSVVISSNPLPTDHPLINSGSYCSGGGGIVVALTGSDIGISYQLYRTTSSGTVSIGTPLAGTGATISFGGHTIAGLYTITATSTTTGCTRTLTSTVTLIFHAPPAPIPISGGGTYCSGGAGVAITMPASAVGVNYQLYRGTTPVGSPLPGVGSSLSFSLQTVPGAYTVVATDMTTGCTRNMIGTVSVAVVASPTAFAMTGGGGYCTGGPGMPVGISGSQTGVNYQLYRSGLAVSGATRPGSGSAISFGMQTIAGTYTAVAISTSTFCPSNMTGSAVITINAVTTYTVTGGGTYCAGGTGVAIGLNGSSTGVNYQLKRGATLVGSPVAGTGGAISFGPQTIAGTYTVVATNPSTGCIANMAGGASVAVNAVPIAYTVTGGGNFCSGSTGVSVGLSGSQTAVLYQLRLGGIPTGSPVAGTGAPLNFGLKTAAGAYTVSANTVGGCSNSMTGSVTVSVNPTPTVFTMAGGGSYCTGGSGIIPTLSASATGINYQLLRGTTTVGSPVAGTGSSLSFGMQTVAGTYTIRATNATTGCTAMMSGSTTISLLPPPTIVPVTGGGGYCSGGTGVAIGLGGAIGGTSYQLYRSGVPVGSPVMGSVGLTFGLQTVAGTYTVVATNPVGCTATMSGSATVTVYALPTIYTVTGGGGYCSGGTGVNIGLSGSSTGTSYRLYRGIVPVSSFVPGTGSALNFGLYPTSGTYNVVATNSVTGCTATMSGSATVSINPVPAYTSTRYTVAPAGTITLNATPSGGNWTSSTTSVATIGSASGIVTGVTLGTTTISYTLPTGCRATRTVAVTPTGFRTNEAGTTAISNTFENSKLSIIPNPNHGTFSIKGQLTTPGDVYAEIVNMLGQKVYSNTIVTDNGEIDREISLPADIARGSYILTLSNENERQTFRVIIE